MRKILENEGFGIYEIEDSDIDKSIRTASDELEGEDCPASRMIAQLREKGMPMEEISKKVNAHYDKLAKIHDEEILQGGSK